MEFQTTFNTDFEIADAFGINAIKDTFERSFNEWKDNYIYLTELCIIMNLRCWHHYELKNLEYSQLYADYYYKTRDYALDHLTGDEFTYFWEMTDLLLESF